MVVDCMNRGTVQMEFSTCAVWRPLIALLLSFPLPAVAAPPNIVLIYVDDLGYGDLGCTGATAVATPHIDRIAEEGCRFTDGHSAAATCTPSRYSLLTGEYAWRRKGTGIAPGDAAAIISPDRVTLATILQRAGYRSAVVGKWHLGLGSGELDWNRPITRGPLDLGFDESFIIPATGDRVPCVYVEGRQVVGLDPQDPIQVSFSGPVDDEPTGQSNPELLKLKWDHGHNATIVNGISRIGFMSGGQRARWVDEDMADVLTARAQKFIEQHVSSHHQQPFFLFFSTHDVHVPRVPHPRFAGRTSLGARGDVIAQLDWCVGQLLATLEQHRLTRNTLVILTSDNGPVLNDGYQDEAAERNGEHRPAGRYRGGKYSSFEAGTRVPLLARWPARIPARTTSDALFCQIDFLATFAALTGESIPEGCGPDSRNLLPALLGEDRNGREHLVQQAGALSIRKGRWKLIEAARGPAVNRQVNIETGNLGEVQLYDLTADPGETRNLAATEPTQVAELQQLLDQLRNGSDNDR
ncbi:MAG: Arylsulfatase [Planctomycetota bacterium]